MQNKTSKLQLSLERTSLLLIVFLRFKELYSKEWELSLAMDFKT